MEQGQTEGGSENAQDLNSKPVKEVFCQPCRNAEKRVNASGYCRDCKEFLCKDCYTYHTNLAICRHHILQDTTNMPQDKSSDAPKDWCIQRCEVHDEELIKYYCYAHAQLGCSICMVLNHRNCEGVEYIPAVANAIVDGQEYTDFNEKIESLIKLAWHIMEVARENVATAARDYTQAMSNVKKLRQEITEALDQVEKDVKEQTKRLSKEDNKRLGVICNKCENVLNDLNGIVTENKTLEGKRQHSQLFINLKRSTGKIAHLEDVLNEIGSKTAFKYNFHRSKEVQSILKTPDKLGKLFKFDRTEAGATHLTDIYVKTPTDRHKCCITGSLVVSEDRLVIADRINDNLKIVDLEQKKVISEMGLPSSPWDIAGIGDGSFAVTLPTQKKILIVSCDGGSLETEREVTVGSECWGIAFSNGKLVVTHENPGSVDIMDMNGTVVQKYSMDTDGKELFKRPSYAAVADDLQTIFVADWDTNSVTSLDKDGKVKQVYKDEELEYPGKLVVDQSGVVTVCGINSSNVHIISSYCTKIQVFKCSITTVLDHPRTLSYSEDNEKLYVGMWENDNIRVFQLA